MLCLKTLKISVKKNIKSFFEFTNSSKSSRNSSMNSSISRPFKSFTCLITLFIILILFLIQFQQCQSLSKNFKSNYKNLNQSNDDIDVIDIMQVQRLSFYRDYFTIGPNKRPQLQCISPDDECDEGGLEVVHCENKDFNNLSKVNLTLDWKCGPEFELGYYYIEPTSEKIVCDELFKTEFQRYVYKGSCSLSFALSKNTFYKNTLFLFIGAIILSLVVGLIFYLRKKRREHYQKI